MADLTAWLDELGLGKYADTLAAHEIDFAVLAELSEADLEKTVICSSFHVSGLMPKIAGINQTGLFISTLNGYTGSYG